MNLLIYPNDFFLLFFHINPSLKKISWKCTERWKKVQHLQLKHQQQLHSYFFCPPQRTSTTNVLWAHRTLTQKVNERTFFFFLSQLPKINYYKNRLNDPQIKRKKLRCFFFFFLFTNLPTQKSLKVRKRMLASFASASVQAYHLK